MLKKIWKFIVGFIVGIGSVLLIIARGNRQTTNPAKDNLSANNTRIRESNNELRELNKREADRIRAEKSRLKEERAALGTERERTEAERTAIFNARRTVSDIIRDAEKDIS